MAHSNEPVLRVGLDASWVAPHVIYQGEQPVAGVVYDAIEQIAKNVQLKVKWQVLPRKRLMQMLDQHQTDMVCHLHPKWLSREYPPERWSGLFMRQESVFIQPPNRPVKPLVLAEVDHLVLGTIFGYQYPALDDYFKHGNIQRLDSPRLDVLLKQTRNGKLPLSVANRLSVEAFNRTLPVNQRLTITQTLDTQETLCLLADKPGLPVAQIKQAIEQLHSSKQLEAIIDQYTR
ncbi:substrate-binding periplasmic protein [Chitinibacter sp. S2-10]|uniref:substrate-binding periplasmic protein n=1 Tax=Chitinibacter sp. S2-10 TaxID=3373597 RepID=UPI0039774CC0